MLPRRNDDVGHRVERMIESWHGPCFTHLLNDPERTWIPGHLTAQNLPAAVADHEEAVQDSEG